MCMKKSNEKYENSYVLRNHKPKIVLTNENKGNILQIKRQH